MGRFNSNSMVGVRVDVIVWVGVRVDVIVWVGVMVWVVK
jgi:hypothetical protein